MGTANHNFAYLAFIPVGLLIIGCLIFHQRMMKNKGEEIERIDEHGHTLTDNEPALTDIIVVPDEENEVSIKSSSDSGFDDVDNYSKNNGRLTSYAIQNEEQDYSIALE